MSDASEALQYMAAVLNDYELKAVHLKAENIRLREALAKLADEKNFSSQHIA
jgi:DNA-binding phage protein